MVKDIVILIIVSFLLIISVITAYFGPKWWLILSALSSLCTIFIFMIIDSFTLTNVFSGLCLGILYTSSLLISGMYVRKRREGGPYFLYRIVELFRRFTRH